MVTPAETAYQQADDRAGQIKELVLSHIELVRRLADRLSVNLGADISRDDLVGAGTLGLVEAAHRFDPSKGVRFVTFAYRRVQGAMMDHLRQNDWLGKSARGRLTELRDIINQFRSRDRRHPTIEELAAAADMSEQDVLKYLSYSKWDCVASLDEPGGEAGERTDALRELVAAEVDSPLEKLEWKEKVEQLSEAIERLPERQKQIIVMYYYEDLYMAEMAEILNISESRVSQLHTRAIYDLTRILEGRR
ncbi:MAG: FliA/WhiG family RNA polymerase sigma factor [Candidatus Brocadiaceae bacterium]|jgi:RNA polymerase sigma factor for flagellar operon FliA